MLSGNGRHRRPRQAPALLVAAGVTGSAIAIPLLGAGSAGAADGLNWDRVAECESGGSWSQNSGNGFYGGLQLTQADWEKYGGLDYASSPDQASRGQQISVAEKILADQGVGAWRTCGLLAGLGQESPAADTSGSTGSSASPGSGAASSTPSPSATSDPSSAADAGERTPAGTVGESADPGETADSGTGSGQGASDGATTAPGASPSATAGSGTDESDKAGRTDGSSAATGAEDTGGGRHRGVSAEEDKGQDRTSDASGRHASRGINAWGGTVADSSTVPEEDASASVPDSPAVGGGWGVLHAVDGQLVGGGPDLVLPGQ
ncbi:transglycosylase family protein [Streptomyces sp. NPDC088106]|uniref:transglycosylase family protein n=1 Tax=Streptomyces TaxID=1883 RepID=UPI00343BF9FE